MAELDMTAICQSFFYPQNYQPGWPPSTRVSLQCAAQAVGAALCQFFLPPNPPPWLFLGPQNCPLVQPPTTEVVLSIQKF